MALEARSDHVPNTGEDRGPRLLAAYWSMFSIAIIIVGLRFWGRLMIRKVGADDYMMLFTLVLFIILTGMVQYYVSIGGNRHIWDLVDWQKREVVKWNWIPQPFGILGFATGKFSIGLLILRLMGSGSQWQKWAIWFAMVSCTLFNSLQCIFTFAQCNPPHLLWDLPPESLPDKRCWNPKVVSDFAIFITAWGVFTDLAITILPITIFWNIRIAVAQKIGLCCLLALSIVAAAIKIQFLTGLAAREDLSWETFNLYLWSGLELFVLIVCGSIPPLKPLYKRFVLKEKTSPRGFPRGRHSQSTSLTGVNRALPFSEFCLIQGASDVETGSSKDNRSREPPPAVAGQIAKRTEFSVSYRDT